MTAVATIRSIVLECSDPGPLARFWSEVLDRTITQRDDDWWALERRDGETRMCFQVIDGYIAPPWPGEHGEQQVHLDLEVGDLAMARATVIGLGARQLSDVVHDDSSGPWQVFADPAGHPFCLVT